MDYMTRHLVARVAMTHEGRELKPGDDFLASQVDAAYLTSRGRADEAVERSQPAVLQQTEAPEIAAENAGEATTTTDEHEIESAPAEPTAQPRRRGRPPTKRS